MQRALVRLLCVLLQLRRANTEPKDSLGHAEEQDDEVTMVKNFQFGFDGCTKHFQILDWNRNVSDQVWETNFARTVNCINHGPAIAKAQAESRPAAMSGVHVANLIVPTTVADLPDQPALYFVVPMWDMVVSNQIRLTGAYDIQELYCLLRITAPGQAFVDIGANIGAVAVHLAAHVGEEGVVYAFEPFRQVFQYLNANIAMNGLSNVHTFNYGLSDASNAPRQVEAPVPTLKAGQNLGMYSIFQGASTAVSGRSSQTRERMEAVSIRTLDSFSLTRVDVIKIDVEGHASRVLQGAVETIRQHRPLLWFEESNDAPSFLKDLDYWCTKLVETQEDQYLCVPREQHAYVQERLNS
mmetsp:Transcript_28611/g.52043  ORF Transcript_28611/g.52043 Transcript_28611/m.52043 type:complete len:354 (-) Transcript_28611:70-1131(-)